MQHQRPVKRPSSATPEVRAAWRELETHDITAKLISRLDSAEQVRVCNSRNRHIKIFGPARTVELYGTTGVVNCGPHNNMKACKHTNMMPERAIDRAITLATKGW